MKLVGTKVMGGIAAFAGAFIIAAAVLAPISGAQAEPRKLKPDLTHASVHFFIKHGGFSSVIGQFRAIEVSEFVFDPNNVANSKVKASVETASLDSNHAYRDNYTRSQTFLNVIKFPKATFESTKVTKTGANTGTMEGNLTIAGVTKPVTFNVTYNKGGKHLSGKYMIDGFTARGTIKRSDFGIKAFIPWVADELEILIQLEGNWTPKG